MVGVLAEHFKQQPITGVRFSAVACGLRRGKQLRGPLAPQVHEPLVPLPRGLGGTCLWLG